MPLYIINYDKTAWHPLDGLDKKLIKNKNMYIL